MARYMLILRGTDESVAKMTETPFAFAVAQISASQNDSPCASTPSRAARVIAEPMPRTGTTAHHARMRVAASGLVSRGTGRFLPARVAFQKNSLSTWAVSWSRPAFSSPSMSCSAVARFVGS